MRPNYLRDRRVEYYYFTMASDLNETDIDQASSQSILTQ